MDWFYFHLGTSMFAFIACCGTPKHPGRMQHIYGGLILVLATVFSQFARIIVGSADPILGYLLIDVFAISGFGVIMLAKKAVWAALTVLFHFFMIVTHAYYFMGESLTQSTYLWTIGILAFLSFLAVLFGGLAGNRSWGEGIDRNFSPRFGAWTWSGVGFPRDRYLDRQMG